MPCDTQLLKNQTISDRKREIKKAVDNLDKLIREGKVRVKIDPIKKVPTFIGWADIERGRITDACAYRRLLVTGSALVKAKLAQAGSVDQGALGRGVHSHDGGVSWHDHKG
jgi:hypothetical protein